MAEGQTVAQACAEADVSVDPARLRAIIRNLPGFVRIGEVKRPAGSQGGRGDALYETGELQDLITVLRRWLVPRP